MDCMDLSINSNFFCSSSFSFSACAIFLSFSLRSYFSAGDNFSLFLEMVSSISPSVILLAYC